MNRMDLYRTIANVQDEHVHRLDTPEGELIPRPRRGKRRPNTALISEYAKRWEEKQKRLAKRKRSAA